MVRERGDVAGLLADADQRARAVHVAKSGASLAANGRRQGRHYHHSRNE